MTERPGGPSRIPPPDQLQRDRIASELDLNFLVEAGAGSGKTTSLSGRMVALVREGKAAADQIAAVTFTRKAAVELRERFQEDIERELRNTKDPEVRRTLAHALTQIDRTFLGTIHAFAARLLRERPLEAGLDPAFRELQENEEYALRGQFWSEWIERLAADGDAGLLALGDVGIRPGQLRNAFDQMVENLDLDFPADPVAAPSEEIVSQVRTAMGLLLDRAEALLPAEEPKQKWGEVQRKVRRALHARRHRAWEDPHAFLTELHAFSTGHTKITMTRWEPDKKQQGPVKQLRDDILAFTDEEGPVQEVMDRWYAHRYPAAVDFVSRAAREYAAERRRLGVVTFQDLLLLTADLLRRSPSTRRDLGERFRYLLVDEFQDTDPVQAEIVFLLASEPTEVELRDKTSMPWQDVVPRPGALFVVGDPKQSIYRFRRADIAVYEQVRNRFETFGEVLHLDTNFRSVLPIAGMANDVFSARFAEEQPPVQARFQPLRPQRPFAGEDPPALGVFHYPVDLKARDQPGGVVQHEAERVAEWLHQRVATGERGPGDFLILTRRKKNLAVFARAIEERGLPLEVAGAGIGYELELDELRHVLRALTDPADEIQVAAVLTGLFFGLDHEQLTRYRLAGGGLDPRATTGEDVVGRALLQLHEWWQRSQREPADVFLGWLVESLGLVAHAAAGELGSIRTGVLTYAMDAVRRAAAAGDASLVGALEALETALSWEEAEAPLRPGATDVVRLMNVHKAKGLEAPVVVLADPGTARWGDADLHVERSERGGGSAYFQVGEREGFNSVPLAQPLGWSAMKAWEDKCDEAEEQRLLYVAATRARDELVVAFAEGGRRRPWAVFDSWLRTHSTPLTLPLAVGRRRERLQVTSGTLSKRSQEAARRRSDAGRVSVRFASVTELAKGEAPEAEPVPAPTPTRTATPVRGPRGYEWGSVVHATLAAAAREVGTTELEALGRDLLREHERPVDDRGEPRELGELMELVAQVRGSEVWHRSEAAPLRHAEVPIATVLDPDPDAQSPAETVLEGVIDLVFKEPGGWVVVDYKTDPGDDPEFPLRAHQYLSQVRLYGEAWARIVGEPVAETLVFYATQQRIEKG